jgi:hypothetical protein
LAVGGGFLLVGLLFVTGRAWDIALAFAAATAVVPTGLLTADYLLRYGGVEYRVSEEAIVAYDRAFRTRLWRIEPWDESGLRLEKTRLLDTSTVVIDCSDRELRVPHLRDLEAILGVFDRRLDGESMG